MQSGVSLPVIEGVVFLLALGALALILALRPRGEAMAEAPG
jgi:hypothetical protein